MFYAGDGRSTNARDTHKHSMSADEFCLLWIPIKLVGQLQATVVPQLVDVAIVTSSIEIVSMPLQTTEEKHIFVVYSVAGNMYESLTCVTVTMPLPCNLGIDRAISGAVGSLQSPPIKDESIENTNKFPRPSPQ